MYPTGLEPSTLRKEGNIGYRWATGPLKNNIYIIMIKHLYNASILFDIGGIKLLFSKWCLLTIYSALLIFNEKIKTKIYLINVLLSDWLKH